MYDVTVVKTKEVFHSKLILIASNIQQDCKDLLSSYDCYI